MSSTQPTSIKLDPEIKDRLKSLAKTRDRTPHWLIKKAISEYLDREEKRQAVLQDAKNAWDNYGSSGEYMTDEEANAWFKQQLQRESTSTE